MLNVNSSNMKALMYILIGLSVFATACEDIPTAGKFALFRADVEIIGDSTKFVTVSYNSIVNENGENQNENKEVTKVLSIPSRFTIYLALNGKSLQGKDLCYLKLETDGNTNVRAILVPLEAKFADGCPVSHAFKFARTIDDCDKYCLGSDSLITLLKSKDYPCIIELTEGQNEGYVTTSDISNTGIY